MSLGPPRGPLRPPPGLGPQKGRPERPADTELPGATSKYIHRAPRLCRTGLAAGRPRNTYGDQSGRPSGKMAQRQTDTVTRDVATHTEAQRGTKGHRDTQRQSMVERQRHTEEKPRDGERASWRESEEAVTDPGPRSPEKTRERERRWQHSWTSDPQPQAARTCHLKQGAPAVLGPVGNRTSGRPIRNQPRGTQGVPFGGTDLVELQRGSQRPPADAPVPGGRQVLRAAWDAQVLTVPSLKGEKAGSRKTFSPGLRSRPCGSPLPSLRPGTDKGHLGVWAGPLFRGPHSWPHQAPGLGRPPLQMHLLPSGGHAETCGHPAAASPWFCRLVGGFFGAPTLGWAQACASTSYFQ